MASPWSVEIRPLGLAACRTLAWRYRGQLRVTAVLKATFSFVQGEAMRLEEPDEIVAEDVHLDGDPSRCVVAASDLAPYRLVADVVLVGHAYVRRGVPVRLAVFHDHALVDKRVVVAPDDPADPTRALDLGPVAASSPARACLVGGLDPRAIGHGVLDVPSDFDWAYFQAAPSGQTTDFLRGDEWIRLEGLDPELPVVLTRLPGAAAAGRLYGLIEGRPPTLAFRADHLHLDTDHRRCTVTWRASFSVASEAQLPRLAILAGVEIGGHPIRWPDSVPISVRAPAPPPPDDDDFGMATIALAPPEPAPAEAPAPSRAPQATVLLEWGEQGVPPPPQDPAPSRQHQPTVVLEWGEQGVPPAASPALAFAQTLRIEQGPGGSPAADVPARTRQSTVLLTWGDDPPAPTEKLHVPTADVAMNYDSPLMGTLTLTEEQAATPLPMASPFRIAEPGAKPAAAAADIPGAPWAAGVPPLVPPPVESERTRSLKRGELLPDDLVDDPLDDNLPTEKIRIKPAAAPAPAEPATAPAAPAAEPPKKAPPADADKGAADRSWSWATVAEPPRAAPAPKPPPPRPVTAPAMKTSLYGKFGGQPKKK